MQCYASRHFFRRGAADARDAMAKSVYGKLFDWLINKINDTLGANLATEAAVSPASFFHVFFA